MRAQGRVLINLDLYYFQDYKTKIIISTIAMYNRYTKNSNKYNL